jgi:hypothetical protein
MRVPASAGVAALLLVACDGGSGSDGAYVVSAAVEGPGRVLSLPPAIDCPGTCVASFASGAWVTLVATSPDEARFVEWSHGCSGATGCGFTVAGDVEVVARFEPMTTAQKK